jgi:hypothetical protein
MRDALHELVHDHGALNRRVIALGSLVRAAERDGARVLVGPLGELREALFLHFAREEEGLFPFIEEVVVELAEQVREMAHAHDAICGALARMLYLARSDGDASSLSTLHERFELAYRGHSQAEAALLQALDERLDAAHRARLAALVDGL